MGPAEVAALAVVGPAEVAALAVAGQVGVAALAYAGQVRVVLEVVGFQAGLAALVRSLAPAGLDKTVLDDILDGFLDGVVWVAAYDLTGAE